MSDEPQKPELPHCRCGTDRDHPHASPEREYGLLGTLYLLWGGTSVPRKVAFRCLLCGEVFDEVKGRSRVMRYVV